VTAAVLSGIGGYLPPTVVTNPELAARLGISEDWIRSRTGIAERHVVEPGMSTVGLAVEAGARAMKSAQLSTVHAVVLATSTPDRLCPASAPEVASRLGLPPVPAMDVGAVCAGFIYALAVGAGLIACQIAQDVLVIGADTFSTIIDPADRDTAAIFGDGAGAVVLRAGQPTEPGALGPFDLGSDGEHAELIMIPAGARQRALRVPADPREQYFVMRGKETFRRAVTQMAGSARAVLGSAGWPVASVDRLVGHQANARILAALAEALDLPPAVLVSNIHRVGNTAAASIPLALADAATAGELRTGQRVLLTSFGGGLAWGSTALCWPELTLV
jgi:3-oxoacyl-[acyl-carrier-protein] synthase-3